MNEMYFNFLYYSFILTKLEIQLFLIFIFVKFVKN